MLVALGSAGVFRGVLDPSVLVEEQGLTSFLVWWTMRSELYPE